MAFAEKTMVLGQDGNNAASSVKCLLCKGEMIPDESGNLKCTVCGYVKKAEHKVGPGSIVAGKYRVLNALGSGGCGEIFLCHPLDNVGVRYALKVHRDLSNSSASLQRFEREAQLLKQLNANRVIVDLIDFWSDESAAYMILEYITGQNLKMAREKYEFDELMTLQIAHEVCYALSYAWETLHLVHRDIKPENIMLDNEGYIRLLDFGMSKSLDESDGGLTLMKTGLGTPGYMSPEQFLEAKNVDFRTDLFSLGATMYFALVGRPPFEGKNSVERYQNTIANTPPPMESLTPAYCSPECADLIRRLMAKEADDRPDSYESVLQEIRALISRFEQE